MKTEKTYMKTYALAIRKNTPSEYESPVIIIKRGLSILEARQKAESMNKTHMPECVALGGVAFVAFNLSAI